MTFLFDIGNVLLKLHFENLINKALSLGDPVALEQVFALKDPLETGTLSEEQFIADALRILNSDLTKPEFVELWKDVFSPHLPMWELSSELKRNGHQLILFSNTNSIHARHFFEKYAIFKQFDEQHFSHEVGSIKPNPEFYQAAVDTYQLDPSETIYLDDLADNISTGKKFGFHSWQYDFNDHEACLKWLEKLL